MCFKSRVELVLCGLCLCQEVNGVGSDLSRILWYFHARADDPSGEVAGYSVAYVCAKRFVGCGSEPRAARAGHSSQAGSLGDPLNQ